MRAATLPADPAVPTRLDRFLPANSEESAAGPVGTRPIHKRGRWRAMLGVLLVLAIQILAAAPAQAVDCSPTPERPGDGFVGAIDQPKLDQGDPANHRYGQYSYAGTTWNLADESGMAMCGYPTQQASNWFGNQAFNVGKATVALNNRLWYESQSQESTFGSMDHGIEHAAKTIFNTTFSKWLGVVLLIVAVTALGLMLTGAVHKVSQKMLVVLAGLWLAGSTFVTPQLYTSFLSGTLSTVAQELQGTPFSGMKYQTVDPKHSPPKGEANTCGASRGQACYNKRDGMAETLYDQVVWRTWLDGEFGTADSKQANKYGQKLLDAQSWKKTDTSEKTPKNQVDQKKKEWRAVKNGVQNTQAEAAFNDDHGARAGVGLLGGVRGIALSGFPLVAQLGLRLGELLLRVLVLIGPIVGLAVMLANRLGGQLFAALGRAFGSVAFLAGASTAFLWLETTVLKSIDDPVGQTVLLALATILFWMLTSPIKQLAGIATSVTSAVGMNTDNSRLHRWATRRRFSRLRRSMSRKQTGDDEHGDIRDAISAGRAERKQARQHARDERAAAAAERLRPESHDPAAGAGAGVGSRPRWAWAQRTDHDSRGFRTGRHTGPGELGRGGFRPGSNGDDPGDTLGGSGRRGPHRPGGSGGGGVGTMPRVVDGTVTREPGRDPDLGSTDTTGDDGHRTFLAGPSGSGDGPETRRVHRMGPAAGNGFDQDRFINTDDVEGRRDRGANDTGQPNRSGDSDETGPGKSFGAVRPSTGEIEQHTPRQQQGRSPQHRTRPASESGGDADAERMDDRPRPENESGEG